jgi:WbqC-like protein family
VPRLVAIHQPNFFPWLGYFDKIRQADIFVFLDDVQYQKTGGTWTNRVQLLKADADEPCWLTAPIDRAFHGTRQVDQIAFASNEDWRSNALRRIAACYRRAPFYDETITLIEPLIRARSDLIAAFNIEAIKQLLSALDLGGKTLLSSAAIPTQSSSTQRLIDITRAVGGTHYLAGGGAAGYQDDDLFSRSGLELVRQGFAHPRYPQAGRTQFTPGLSIIDVLMHCGINGTSAILGNRVSPPETRGAA